MCGRYAASRRPDQLVEEFVTEPTDSPASMAARHGRALESVAPDFNAAPTKTLPVVRERLDEAGDVHRVVDVMRWGLVPSWAKDAKSGPRMINARVESLTEKPFYRRALARRRVLVPADGWYEWGPPRLGEKTKQPYFMTRRDGHPLALAGLYELWRPPGASEEEPWLVTFTIVTEPAVGPLLDVHDRMPFALPRSRWAAWLDPRRTEAADLLAPTPADYVEELEIRPVSRSVNDVRNNGADLVAPLPPEVG